MRVPSLQFKWSNVSVFNLEPIFIDFYLLVLLQIIKSGNGQKLPPHAKVWINYRVMCEEFDEAIDDTFEDDRYSFKLGDDTVLPALDLGVATMELREVAQFMAESSYAYGPLGLPGKVPADCKILFTVLLVDFMETTGVNSIFDMTSEERASIDFEEVYKAANELKVSGNEHFLGDDSNAAMIKYRKAIGMLDQYVTVIDDFDQRRNDLLFILYINYAQCYLQTNYYEKAVSMCHRALALPPRTKGNKCKAYYRLAKAEYELGRFESSGENCRKAFDQDPNNPDVRALLEQVTLRLAEEEKESRKLMKRMMGITEP